jgi:signal transduction histidine kinase
VNSVEAMHGEGEGWVEVRTNGSELHVTVCDAGEGFPAEACERIFERGFTTKRKGSGYGLYLARKLVQENGGRLTARPGEGRGAVFELALPLASARGAGAVAS